MWSVLLAYGVPAAVTLYGVTVLATGRVGGFGTRVARGTAARVLGVVLLAALPLAIVFGPSARLGSAPASKADLAALARETEITRQVLDQHRQLRLWREQHMPDPGAQPTEARQMEERTRALREFGADYDRRKAEVDERVLALRDEQARLRKEREDRGRQQHKAEAGRGAPLVGVAVLACAWAVAWLVGKPPVRDAAQTPPGPAGPGGVAPAADEQHET